MLNFGFTKMKTRDPFGRIEEEQNTFFQELRQSPLKQTSQTLGMLDNSVGRKQENKRIDVAKVEALMQRNSVFDTRADGPTGLFSVPLDNAIKDLQRSRGLDVDGLIMPLGETIQSLIQPLAKAEEDKEIPKKPPPPIPQPKPDIPKPRDKPDPEPNPKPDCSDWKSYMPMQPRHWLSPSRSKGRCSVS